MTTETVSDRSHSHSQLLHHFILYTAGIGMLECLQSTSWLTVLSIVPRLNNPPTSTKHPVLRGITRLECTLCAVMPLGSLLLR